MALIALASGVWLFLRAGTWLICGEDRLEKAGAILVLNGDVGFERTKRAAELLKAGWAPIMIVSGFGSVGDSARAMKAEAVRLGAPADRILTEELATDTYENMKFSKPILEKLGARSVIIVTSSYHSRRAAAVAEKVLGPGIRVTNSPVHNSFFDDKGWWKSTWGRSVVFSEVWKLTAWKMVNF